MKSAAHKNEKILLVDDEVAVRNLYQQSLEKHGLAVFTAAGARDALQALHDLAFDVAVIDLHLEDGEAMEIVRRIKSAGQPKVLIMSDYAEPEKNRAEVERAGVPVYSKLDPLSELVRLISVA